MIDVSNFRKIVGPAGMTKVIDCDLFAGNGMAKCNRHDPVLSQLLGLV